MKDKLSALLKKPWVAHLLRANTRYGNRLGSQFAAAITYFSVLALVPILMFAFSMLGMTVTTLRPDLLDSITQRITRAVGDAGAGQQISDLIAEYLRNWRGVGIVGLLSLLYAGSGWAGNIRRAVQAQWRPEFEHVDNSTNIVVTKLQDLGVLIVLLLGVGGTFAVTLAGTALNGLITSALNVDTWPGGPVLVRVASYLLTALSAWLLFLLIFVMLPKEHRITKPTMVGAAIAAVVFTVVQVLTGVLMGVFQGNKAASLFGPVIVLMLFMNIFAQVILFIASWIATSHQPAVAFHYNEADEPLRGRDDTVTADDHWRLADEERAELQADKAERSDEKMREQADDMPRTHTISRPYRAQQRYRPPIVTLDDYPNPDPNRSVSEPVAARSVKVGTVTGWVMGAATGLGAGALITSALQDLRTKFR